MSVPINTSCFCLEECDLRDCQESTRVPVAAAVARRSHQILFLSSDVETMRRRIHSRTSTSAFEATPVERRVFSASGGTASLGFPTTSGMQTGGGTFVAKLDPDG